jgi:hypothetical protein
VLRGVRAPRSPALRPGQQRARIWPASLRVGHRTDQADVGGGERVWLTELAHGDVLSGPLANSGERSKLLDRVIEAAPGAKDLRIGRDRFRKRRQGARACSGHAERRQVDSREAIRTREDVREPIEARASQGFAVPRHEPAGQGHG